MSENYLCEDSSPEFKVLFREHSELIAEISGRSDASTDNAIGIVRKNRQQTSDLEFHFESLNSLAEKIRELHPEHHCLECGGAFHSCDTWKALAACDAERLARPKVLGHRGR